jgi:hypothetical protein
MRELPGICIGRWRVVRGLVDDNDLMTRILNDHLIKKHWHLRRVGLLLSLIVVVDSLSLFTTGK